MKLFSALQSLVNGKYAFLKQISIILYGVKKCR